MLEAAREAESFVRGRDRTELGRDRMLAFALVRCIEIIGEAGARVNAETRQKHPAVPWANIVAMRNRLIHAYFDIDLDRVWDTVAHDLPFLISELEKVLREEGGP